MIKFLFETKILRTLPLLNFFQPNFSIKFQLAKFDSKYLKNRQQ